MKYIIPLILFLVLITPALGVDLQKGEKVNIWIEIEERSDASFTIGTSVFEVMDRDGAELQASGSATVDNTNHYVYGIVDTSASGFTNGLVAQVKFTYIIGAETFIFFVPIQVFLYMH